MTAKKDAKSNHIEIVRYCKGSDGELFVDLAFSMAGRRRKVAVRTDQAIEFGPLQKAGAHLLTNQAKNDLINRLQDQIPTKYERVITRAGWHGNQFVLPSDRKVRRYFSGKKGAQEKFRCHGTLKKWKRLGQLAEGNSRFMLALATAFVGPLGPILKCEAVGIQLRGQPQDYKSTLLVAAASAWGSRRDPNYSLGFAESWNTTSAEVERTAIAHTQTFLALDEFHNLKDKPITTINILDAGVEKARWTNSNDPIPWYLSMLSSSNVTVFDAAKAEGLRNEDQINAVRTRMIDVPPPVEAQGGIIEDLKGHSLEVFAKLVRDISKDNYGVASREYVEKLTVWRKKDRASLRAYLEKRTAYYYKRAKRIPQTGNHNRIHAKFATIYAAGCLATKFGIFEWSQKSLRTALISCELSHIKLAEESLASLVASEDGVTARIRALVEYIKRGKDKIIKVPLEYLQKKPDLDKCILRYRGLYGKTLRNELCMSNTHFERIFGKGKAAAAVAAEAKRELLKLSAIDHSESKDRSGRFVLPRAYMTRGLVKKTPVRDKFVVLFPEALKGLEAI